MSDAKLSACRGKALTVLAVVFVAGAALGAAGMRAFEHGPAHASVPPDRIVDVAVKELTAQLELTPEQAERVKLILDESIMLEADHFAQIRGIRENGRSQILRLLDHEQRVKFDRQLYPVAQQRSY
jgi:hypothetical protein